MAEADSLWSVVRRKVVAVSTMDREVRITFAAGSAIVAAATLLNILRPGYGSAVRTIAGDVPLGVLALFVIGELIVMTLFFTAIMRCGGRLRLAALTLVSVVTVFYFWLADFALPAFLMAIPTGMLWWLAMVVQQREWDLRRTALAAAGIGLVVGLLLTVFAAVGQQELVVSALGLQAMFAMFGLFMAATDMGELIVVGSQTVVGGLTRISTSRAFTIPLMFVAVVINIAVLRAMEVATVPVLLGSGLGVAIWLGLAFWLVAGPARKLGHFPPQMTYRALFLIVLFYFVALVAGLMQRVLGAAEAYNPQLMFTFVEIFTLTTAIMLVYIVLLFAFGRRSPQRFVHFSYGALVGFFWFFYFASEGRNLTLFAAAVAMGSIVFLGVVSLLKSTRPRLGQIAARLAELNIAFTAYILILTWFLSGTGGGETSLSLGQALVVFAALGWDIVSSGDAITNKHSSTFPRIARVCFFFTYIITVSLFVLLASSSDLVNPITGAAVEGVFDSDKLVAVGLGLFGPAFFFLVFGLRMRGIRQAEPDADAPRQQEASVTPPPAAPVAPAAPAA